MESRQQKMLLSSLTRLAERKTKAGVEVQFDQGQNMYHVWQLFALNP
jgi:hypothetical protein